MLRTMQESDFAAKAMQALQTFAMQSPITLVYLSGFVMILARRRSLQNAALPAALGFGFLLLLSVVNPVIWAFLPALVSANSPGSMHSVYRIMGVVNSLFYALAFVLVLLGVLMGRSRVPGTGAG
jgi:cytochrome b561